MNSIWYRLARNTASNLLGSIIPLAAGFFLTPFVIQSVGSTAYGIWMLATSVIGYMGLINLGLGPTVTKKAAEYLARNDFDGLNRVMSTMLLLYVGLGVLMGIVILTSESLLPSLFGVDSNHVVQFKVIIRLIGLQAALGFPFAVFAGLLHGRQDFHISTFLSTGSSIFRIVGTVFLLNQGGGLVGLLTLEFTLNICTWVFQVIVVKRRIPKLCLHWNLFQIQAVVPLFRFSGVMLIWRTAALTLHRAHRILIGLFFPLSTITLWEIGSKLAEYPRMGFMSFLTPIMPASSELKAQGNFKSLRGVYLRGTKSVFAGYAGAAVMLYVWGPEFVKLWVGTEFLPIVPVLSVLLIGNLYQTQNVVAHVMLPSMDKLRIFTFVMAMYPIVSIGLSLVLINASGLIGLAYGITCSIIFLETILLRYILRIFGLTVREFLRECHAKVFVCLVPAFLFSEVLQRLVTVDTWGQLIKVTLSFLSLYGILFYSWGLTRGERANLREVFARAGIITDREKAVVSATKASIHVQANSADTNCKDVFHECSRTKIR